MYPKAAMPMQVSQALALPAPTGGLNDLDPLSNMDPAFMIDCMNIFPDTGLCVIRPGYAQHSAVYGDLAIKTIMEYRATDGAISTFVVTDAGIYDIVTGTKVHDLTEGYVNYVNFANAGKVWLVGCNGVDPAFLYDGTTWTTMTEVATPANPGEISGLNPSDISYVNVHSARLWFVKKNSMEAFYMPVDAVGGAADPFPVAAQFAKGGYIMALMRWSSDTGKGLDDRLVFITSAGEIASYTGNDPSDAANFQIDSVFYLAPPLGERAITQYGGDVLILVRRGVIPLSVLMYGTSVEQAYGGTLSRRINRAIQRITAEWKNLPSKIELTVHVELLWISITLWDPAPQVQKPVEYVMNVLTGAWGRFDYPAHTIITIDNITYFGTYDGRLCYVTPNDFRDEIGNPASPNGTPINGYAMGAYTYLNDPTVLKHAKLIRPVFQAEVKPSFRMRVLPDFRTDPYPVTVPPGLAFANARWDVSFWDLSNWASLENVYKPWLSANKLGYAFAWQLKISTSSGIGLAAVEWVWENGGLV